MFHWAIYLNWFPYALSYCRCVGSKTNKFNQDLQHLHKLRINHVL